MKKFVVVTLTSVTVACVMFSFDVMDNNGQAGRTGSPGENTCNITCHTGFPLNDGTGSVTISSPDLTGWEYMTGDTYDIEVTVSRTGNSLFGIGVECLNGSSPPQNAGTLIITNTTETQIKNATVQTVSRRNVVHKLNGGIGTDTKTFTFKWAAPTTNVGNVTFYLAGNAANGNNATSGDHIYTTTQVVTPALGAGMEEQENEAFSIYPNPAREQLTVTYDAVEDVSFQLYSLDGKEIATLHSDGDVGMERTVTMRLPAGLPAGVYLVKMSGRTSSVVKKVVVE